jgi:hypothetical protein
MYYEIVLCGVPPGPLRHRVAELVGDERLRVEDGHLVVALPDQSALVGVLHTINELGCDVDVVRRGDDRIGHPNS